MGSIKPEIFVIRLDHWSFSNNMTSVLGFLSHFHDNKFKFSAHQEKYLHIEDMSRRQIQGTDLCFPSWYRIYWKSTCFFLQQEAQLPTRWMCTILHHQWVKLYSINIITITKISNYERVKEVYCRHLAAKRVWQKSIVACCKIIINWLSVLRVETKTYTHQKVVTLCVWNFITRELNSLLEGECD
jgi:hypothetical protein